MLSVFAREVASDLRAGHHRGLELPGDWCHPFDLWNLLGNSDKRIRLSAVLLVISDIGILISIGMQSTLFSKVHR